MYKPNYRALSEHLGLQEARLPKHLNSGGNYLNGSSLMLLIVCNQAVICCSTC